LPTLKQQTLFTQIAGSLLLLDFSLAFRFNFNHISCVSPSKYSGNWSGERTQITRLNALKTVQILSSFSAKSDDSLISGSLNLIRFSKFRRFFFQFVACTCYFRNVNSTQYERTFLSLSLSLALCLSFSFCGANTVVENGTPLQLELERKNCSLVESAAELPTARVARLIWKVVGNPIRSRTPFLWRFTDHSTLAQAYHSTGQPTNSMITHANVAPVNTILVAKPTSLLPIGALSHINHVPTGTAHVPLTSSKSTAKTSVVTHHKSTVNHAHKGYSPANPYGYAFTRNPAYSSSNGAKSHAIIPKFTPLALNSATGSMYQPTATGSALIPNAKSVDSSFLSSTAAPSLTSDLTPTTTNNHTNPKASLSFNSTVQTVVQPPESPNTDRSD
jgi:hypothetical protein